MEQKKGENGQKIAIAAISVVLCAALFYFFYYTKTPVYSMKLIGEAVQKHDLETFDRHVDVKHMAGRVFDDFVAKESKDKNGSLAGNAFALGLVTALKPVAVSEMQDAIYAEVVKKDAPSQQKKTEIKVFDKFRSNSKFATFKDISTISKNGETAIVGVKYHNRKVDKDYTLNIKMEKLNDGKWRAKELTNLLELLDQTKKDEAEKLKELDKPFKEQVWKSVELTDYSAHRLYTVNNYYESQYFIEAKTALLNKSGKKITKVTGFIQLEHVDAPFVSLKRFKMRPISGIDVDQQAVTFSETKLNPYNEVDKEIINLYNSNKLFVRHFVMSLTFEDGTKIVRPTKLPDPK
mgnify:CR=1 FL=1